MSQVIKFMLYFAVYENYVTMN